MTDLSSDRARHPRGRRFAFVGAPFGALFLGYVALVVLATYTTIGLVASVDGDAVRERLAQAPERAVGGVLGALLTQTPVDAPVIAVHLMIAAVSLAVLAFLLSSARRGRRSSQPRRAGGS